MTATLTAVVTRDGRSVPRMAGDLHLGERLDGSRALALNMAPAVFPRAGSVGLLYSSSDVRGLYQLIAVDAAVYLYAGAWTTALLAKLIEMLEPGGELVLPFVEPPDGRLSLDAITELLGVEPVEVAGRQARFRPARPLPVEPSVLDWAMRDYAALVHDFLLPRLLRRSTDVLMLDDLLLEVLADSAEVVVSARRELAAAGFDGGDEWFERPDEPVRVSYSAEYDRVARIIAWHL